MGFTFKREINSCEDSLVNEDCDTTTDNNKTSEVVTKKIVPEPFKLSTNIYNYRSTKKERIFVPPSALNDDVSQLEQDESCNDFISLSNYTVPDNFDDNLMQSKINKRYIDLHGNKKHNNSRNDPISISERNNNNNTSNKTNLYVPLKVKKIQENLKRSKATKISKNVKKKKL